MNSDALFQHAFAVAVQVHATQHDRYGAPYLQHVLRVAERCLDPLDKVIALLHDVVEDSDDWTLDRLHSEGFPDEVVAAVDCLTRRPDEPYTQSIDRVASNPRAVRVKLCDLQDNLDIRRAPALATDDLDRVNRYLAAFHRLRQIAPR